MEFLNGGSLHSPRHVLDSVTVSRESSSYTSKALFISDQFSSCNSFSTSTTSTFSPLKVPSMDRTPTNGNISESRLITPTKVGVGSVSGTSPSSFIAQRVERLYGPAALAQGFYTPRRHLRTSLEQSETSPKEGDISAVEAMSKNEDLPVLKLLRPEFRAQLRLASRKSRQSDPSPHQTPRKGSLNGNDSFSIKPDNIDQLPSIEVAQEAQKDGHYFLKKLDEEVRELERLASEAEGELETIESEEGAGVLRAAAGKARLLVAQKLQQFRGLCTNNINQTENECFPTTNEDLAGFWDMVMIQVRQVQDHFKDLDALRANNWITPESVEKNGSKGEPVEGGDKPSMQKVGSKKAVGQKGRGGGGRGESKTGEAGKARDEARRRLIEEKRKEMRRAQGGGGEGPVNGAADSRLIIL